MTNNTTSNSELADELVRTCRTTVGDHLRSVTYFDQDTQEQLYLRDDLEQDADLVGFAEHERFGFRAQSDYRRSELGAYRYTIRAFEHGYLVRTIIGEHGAFVTTDETSIQRFNEVASGVSSILEAHDVG